MDNLELYLTACAKLKIGDKEEAKKILKALSLVEDSASCYKLGQILMEEGNIDEAVGYFQTAAEKGHKPSKAVLNELKKDSNIDNSKLDDERRKKLIETTCENVLYVKNLTDGSTGTAFLLKGGLIVSNKHVVDDDNKRVSYSETKLTGTPYGMDKSFDLKAIYADKEYDIAFLVPVNEFESIGRGLNLNTKKDLQMGDFVATIGCPLGTKYSCFSGCVGNPEVLIRFTDKREHNYLKMAFSINSGNSGGPVINSRGLVEGISTWSAVTNNKRANNGNTFYQTAEPDKGYAEKTESIIKLILEVEKDYELLGDRNLSILKNTIKEQKIF